MEVHVPHPTVLQTAEAQTVGQVETALMVELAVMVETEEQPFPRV
jgi:hypothetical protein